MAISLGGIELPDQLIWANEFSTETIAQSTARTLGGRLLVYEQTLAAGTPIVLEARTDQGWFTKDQVVAVRALAAVASTSYTLVFGTQSFDVIFDRSNGASVSFEPLVFRVDAPDTDYFIGTINLLTV